MNILIVNDDPALLDALSEMLTMRIPQATVSTSDNPRHTLNTLDTQGYDLVIEDVKMPGMDGFTFVRAVTAKYPAMPIIMLTGHGEPRLDQRAIEAGACTFIRKPLDRDHLVKTVQELLRRHRKT